MKALNLLTLILVIVGGLNWGTIAAFDTDMVASIFGADTMMTNIVYGLVGISAIWQLVPFFRAMRIGEDRAEANARVAHR